VNGLGNEEQEYLKLIAYTFLYYGKWEKAWAVYEALEVLCREDPQVTKGLILAGFHTQRFPQALVKTQWWLQKAPPGDETTAARLMHARILWALGRHHEARQSLATPESS